MCKLSIIVPVYNSEKYLSKCLDSLIKQTLADIEIIVVNDGSVDNSENIIKKYQRKDKRIKLFNKENGGQATARNFGFSKSQGEYIAFIDSDDYAELKFCKETYEMAKKNDYDIVVFDYYVTKKGKDNYFKILKDALEGEIDAKQYFFTGAGPCNKIYKRKFLEKNNFSFPEKIIYEDYAVIPTLAKYNPKIYYMNKAFLHYVQTEVSTMRSDVYKTKFEDIFEANEILKNSLLKTEFYDELEYLVSYHMLYLGSLNFYKYGKNEQISRISEFVKLYFPNWQKNKYVKTMKFKTKFLMNLFYSKRIGIIKFFQKIKRCIK